MTEYIKIPRLKCRGKIGLEQAGVLVERDRV